MIRSLARPLLATWFVYDGVQNALEPAPRAVAVEPVVTPVLGELGVEAKTVDVVRAHAVATAAAAAVLALSRTPRTAGLALTGLAALSLAADRPFWRLPEGPSRDEAIERFAKNLSLVGGAMLAATAGHGAGHNRRKKARKAKAKAKAAAAKAERRSK